MSRVGKKLIIVPNGVKVIIKNKQIDIEGPRGKLSYNLHERINIEHKSGVIEVKRLSDSKQDKSLHGTVASLIANLVKGVTSGYEKQLEITGVGYKAQMQGKKLVLNLGFSHPVEYKVPEGIEIQVPSATKVIVKGIDKAAVGAVAARIRMVYPPEPYKGKGIKYTGEYIRRKAGKKVA